MVARIRLLGLILLLAGLPEGGRAQDPLESPSEHVAVYQESGPPLMTLDDAVDLALGQNRKVKNAGLEVARAADGVAAFRALRFPQINVGVYESYNLTNEPFTFPEGSLGEVPGIGEIPTTETQIDSAQDFTTLVTARVALPVSQQYSLGLGVEQREVAEDRATQQLRSTRQSTAKNVRDLYYGLLRNQATLAATEASITYLSSLSGLVERNVTQQRALESDSLSVRTELARAQQHALSEHNEIANQREEMNLLLGRDIDTPFRLSELPNARASDLDTDSAESLALAQRPAIRDAELQQKDAELGVKIKKAEYLPELSVEVRYTSPFGAKFVPKNLASVGLSARWHVWDWGKRSHEVAAKQLELKQAENQVREAQDQVRLEVNRKLRALRQAEAQIPVAQLAAKTSREKLRVVDNKYRQSTALIEDVLKAQADLAQSRRDVEEAKLGVWKGWADLQKALGED